MMKFDRVSFTKAFQQVAAAVPGKTTKDVLKNVLLIADGMKIQLWASNGEVHLKSELDYVGEPEKMLLPTARILSILREIEGEVLSLTIGASSLTLKCGSSKFTLGIDDPDNFPQCLAFDATSYAVIQAPVMADAIAKTIFCTDEQSAKYALGGIKMQIGRETSFASTDARRLSVVICQAELVNDFGQIQISSVIPSSAMRLIVGILDKEPCRIAIGVNSASFQIGRISIAAQLVQGRFPDFVKVIPKEEEIKGKVTIPVGPFQSLIRRIRVMETAERTGIDLTFESGKLTVMSASQDIGQASDEIPIAYDGPKLQLSFSGKYVADLLKCLESGSAVEVCLVGEEDRTLFVQENFRHVIMPLSRE